MFSGVALLQLDYKVSTVAIYIIQDLVEAFYALLCSSSANSLIYAGINLGCFFFINLSIYILLIYSIF